jgi:flagellin
MSAILLSESVRSSLSALKQTNDLLTTTQNRLATGKRVNSANDDPVVFFAASAMSNRAADLESVVDSIVGAKKVLESTQASHKAISELVESAQSTARSALANAGTTARTTGTVANLSASSSFSVVSGRTLTFNDGSTTATITSTGAVTVQQVMDGINNTANLRIKASLTADGKLQLEATQANAITIGGTATPPELAQFGMVAGTTAAGTVNAARTAFASQFDALRTQIDQLASDATFNGTNLLTGNSLRVAMNEKATTSFSIVGVTDTSAGLGIGAAGNGFQTDKDINDALTGLTNSLNTLRSQAAAFASNNGVLTTRLNFTQSLISTLESAADSLVAADINEEGANLLALQTRQQLSSTALTIAAQNDQTVLRLIR